MCRDIALFSLLWRTISNDTQNWIKSDAYGRWYCKGYEFLMQLKERCKRDFK